ncbi:hypothetical protein PMm318_A53510 [Pseudomonas moorei]
MGASAGDGSAIRPPSRYIEVRQAGVYGIYIGNDDTGKIHFIRRAPCRSEPAPGGVPTMDVNDEAGCLNARVARSFIASRLAPTEATRATPLLTTHQAER